ncbi:hypothetical protein CesoFtcFv8_007616 [Champsocephalus esox]|uniref:Uncharacterized protein n=1 Tax=Champsocephalus esox TaxID=159716 RepID=A0AAN8CEY8_9TELE|nr:hypothetical protein CesoFtcFv8_007616 [Champsocephalus esox]
MRQDPTRQDQGIKPWYLISVEPRGVLYTNTTGICGDVAMCQLPSALILLYSGLMSRWCAPPCVVQFSAP